MKHNMIKKTVRIFCVALCCTLLSACGNQAFDCPYQDGVRCMRLGEVDTQVSQGKLGFESESASKSKKQRVESQILQPLPVFALDDYSPLRSREEVLRIWLAPYQSEDGTYHEQNILHFVAKEASWNLPHALIENPEEAYEKP